MEQLTVVFVIVIATAWGLPCQETSVKFGIAIDCRYCDLSEVPNNFSAHSVALDLSQNKLSALSEKDFDRYELLKVLNCSHNQITRIFARTFDNLIQLEKLDLSLNKLQFNEDTFPLEMFHNNPHMTTLLLAGQYGVLSDDLNWTVQSILHLSDLTRLSLSPIDGKLPAKLASLPKLRVLDLQWGRMSTLEKSTLAPFANSSIQQLSFHKCDVKEVKNETFNNFKNLKLLNLACNFDLNPSQIIDALSTSANHSIDSLVGDGSYTRPAYAWEFGHDDSRKCRSVWKQFRRLSFRGIRLKNIYSNISRCARMIETISWGYADLIKYDNETEVLSTVDSLKILNMARLRAISIQHLKGQNTFGTRESLSCYHSEGKNPPRNEEYFVDTAHYEDCHPLPSPSHSGDTGEWCFDIPRVIGKCLQYVDISYYSPHRFIDVGCIRFPPNNIQFFNMSHCEGCAKRLEGPVYGLDKLNILDLSFSKITGISEKALQYMPLLKELYLDGNNLHTSGLEPFPLIKSLAKLSLSDNGLVNLNQCTFTKLTSLSSLSLANNGLKNINFLPNHMKALRYLDISDNEIISLGYVDTKKLDELNDGHGQSIVNIINNPFVCDCSHIPFIRWFRATNLNFKDKEHITCSYNEYAMALYLFNVNKLEEDCRNIFLLVSVSVAVPTVVLLTVFICYRKRWAIKWHYHVLKRYINHRHMHDPRHQTEQKFHAFVIFPLEDDTIREWVFRVLRPKVENEWGMMLYLFGRDDIPGAYVMDNVVDGIKNNRRALWLITPEFVTDNICVHAAHFALCHLNVESNMIIRFENNRVENGHLPRSMFNILNPKMKIKRLKFTEADSGNRLFWNRLQLFFLDDQHEEDRDVETTRSLISP